MKTKHVNVPALPALEWAEDLSGGCARVVAIGSRCLRVENHTGVLDLSDTCAVIGSRRGPLRVEGTGLTLCDVRADTLVVRGNIARIQLPCRGGDGR